MHPQKLPDHETQIYLNNSMFQENEDFDYVRAYYHDKVLVFPINMHKHNFYEINIIYQGTGYHYIKEQCFEAKEGSVFIIPPNVKHGYYTDNEENFIIFHILIHPLFMEKYKRELNSMPGFSILFEIEPKLRSKNSNEFFLTLYKNQIDYLKPLFNKLVSSKIFDSFNEIERIERIGCLLSIISILTKYLTEKNQLIMEKALETNTIDSTFIIKTMEYINNNYSEKITIDKLAKMANMSRTTYIRHFEKLNDKSVNKYLTKIRIKAACDMLKSTNLSITEISNRCGFFDSSHFSKAFKSMKKILPLAYREKERNE